MKNFILLLLAAVFCNGNIHTQTVTDYDGNVYKTVTIGSQVWLLENLKVSHYRNGDSIIETKDSIPWAAQTNGAWCYFKNNPNNGKIYGSLYNGYAVVDPRGLAPVGCHIPTDEEWKTLEMFLGMSANTANLTDWRGANEGAMLKEIDTIHWHWPTGNAATNISGFTALGSGWRNHSNPAGYTSFINLTNTGQWWTSTYRGSDLWMRNLCVYHTDIYRTYYPKQHGCAVRCILDFGAKINVQNQENTIQTYPNPVATILFVKLKSFESADLQIFNSIGREIMKIPLSAGENKIDVSTVPNGIVIAYIKTTDGKYSSFKIIIKH